MNQHQKVDFLNPIKINAFEALQLNQPFHYHPLEYELTIVLGGRGIRFVGDNISQFGCHDLALIGPGIPHSWINENPNNSSSEQRVRVIVIHFIRHFLSEELLSRSTFAHINNLFKLSEQGLIFGEETSKKVADKLLQLTLEPDFDTFLNILDIFNQLAESEDYKTLCSESYVYKGKSDEINKFEIVFDHIQSNFLNRIKISEVASLADMNDSAFSHYFKKRTQYSFTDFINVLRLNYAAQQIIARQKNIAEICFDSGFNNLSNFNRMFKKWKNVTPLQYRKKQMNTQDSE